MSGATKGPLAAILVALALACAPADEPAMTTAAPTLANLADWQIVDLTHPFDEQTLYWPTAPSRFRLDTLSYGETDAGYFYSAFAYSAPEHGGTHLDAPIHFADGGATADAIPLERLVAPAVVIDVSDRAQADRDYLLGPDDVLAWEAEHGRIPEGAIVLLRTGWDRFWPNARAYLGDDRPNDASNLNFPSYGAEAARLLVNERRVAALGVDVASIDGGRSTDFMVHRIAMAEDVPGFENLAALDRLPPTGAIVIALPMKIAGGSGGPLRAIALVPGS